MGLDVSGWYVIPSRTQSWGLAEWERYVDAMAEDGHNLLILWIAGGFPSRRYPASFDYNLANRNVQEDFAGRLIDYAHERGVKVLLGFGAFCYDGVNRLPLVMPEIAGKAEDGSPAPILGIHSMGRVICPASERGGEVMLDYVREMYFDFYPNADGLFVESSDYPTCACPACSEGYYILEWDLVRRLSEEVWGHDPEATVVIYPHYWRRHGLRPDPRHVLFFTPHSAPWGPDVAGLPNRKVSWELGFAVSLARVRELAAQAAEAGLSGFIVSMEAFDYELSRPESFWGRPGDRLRPFDLPWLAEGAHPIDDLCVRVVRFNYAESVRSPGIPEEELLRRAAAHFFGDERMTEAAADLFALVELLQADWDGFLRRGPLVHPEDLPVRFPGEALEPARAKYAAQLERVRRIAERYGGARGSAGEMARLASWVVAAWEKCGP